MTKRKWVPGLLIVMAILATVVLANCQGGAEPEEVLRWSCPITDNQSE